MSFILSSGSFSFFGLGLKSLERVDDPAGDEQEEYRSDNDVVYPLFSFLGFFKVVFELLQPVNGVMRVCKLFCFSVEHISEAVLFPKSIQFNQKTQWS